MAKYHSARREVAEGGVGSATCCMHSCRQGAFGNEVGFVVGSRIVQSDDGLEDLANGSMNRLNETVALRVACGSRAGLDAGAGE